MASAVMQATGAASCSGSLRVLRTLGATSSSPAAAVSLRRRTTRLSGGVRQRTRPAPRGVVTCGAGDPNFFVEFFQSALAAAAVGAVTIATSENRDAEIERVQTVEGAIPLAAAFGADLVAHSIPGLNVLLGFLSEPAGAAAGVAYLMTLVLSSPAVDPKTLAPAGTVLNAEKAADVRASVRVPFTQIIPTALKVVDTSNEYSSGKGWATGKDGLPKLPITSVLIVIGVGSAILELIAHAPVLTFVLPPVLSLAAWFALIGAVLDKRE